MNRTSSRLKPVRFNAQRGINVIALAQGYREPALPTLEAYDESGRRHLITFDAERLDALVAQIERTKEALAREAQS